MAFDDRRNETARWIGTGVVLGGFGYAGYRGWKDFGASKWNRVTETARIATNPDISSLKPVAREPIEFMTEQLSGAFSAIEDVMSEGGRREFLRRAYTRALYSNRVVSDGARDQVVEELLSAGTKWREVRGALLQKEAEFGGLENVYRAMRDLSGGYERGRRGKGVAELLMGLDPIRARGPNYQPGAAGYVRSAFEPGGSYWSDIFPGTSKIKDITEAARTERMRGVLPQFNEAAVKLEEGFAAAGIKTASGDALKVAVGLKDVARPGEFRGGVAGFFETTVPGKGKVELPYYQLRLGGRGSNAVVNVPVVPQALEKAGLNLVAADHTGYSFATLPHLVVPKRTGVGYEVVTANEGLSRYLYGDGNKLGGLPQMLHRYQQEGKTARDLAKDVNAQISSLFHRVYGSQGDLTLARLHSQSAVDLEQLISGERVTMGSIREFAGRLGEATAGTRWTPGPLASPDPMSKRHHLALQDFASRWDMYGEYYPIEKRYLQRFREYGLSETAAAEMASKPIFGILPRSSSLTMTAKGRAGAHAMPMVVGAYSLQGARHLGEEEAVLSRSLAGMVETRKVETLKLRVDDVFGLGTVGDELMEGELIGVDYATGKAFRAQRRPNVISQRIIGTPEKIGNVAFVQLETTYPAQDLTKIFGPKAVYHLAREKTGVAKELFGEWNAKKVADGLLYKMATGGKLEFIAHSGTLKGGMADVLKQMTEAAWVVGAQRPGIAGITDVTNITSENQRALWQFVNRQEVREGAMRRWIQEGGKERGAAGVGADILKFAKRMGFTSEEIGLIGGLYYQEMGKNDRALLNQLLGEAGLSQADVRALRGSEFVLGMPTLHIGEYGSQRWKRARMDPRALEEIAAQQWGEPGDLLLRELTRRIEPEQAYGELDPAFKSLLGKDYDIPREVRRIGSLRDAKEALGKEGFLLEYGGESLYVPGPTAKRMGTYTPGVGERPVSESLRRGYADYINALTRKEGIEGARESLLKRVEMEWQRSTSFRGELIGAEAQMARRWLPEETTGTLAKMFSYNEVLDPSRSKELFTLGLGREPAERIFEDLMKTSLTTEERAFVAAQREAFFRGEEITGTVMRHPTHRPQSLMPARFRYVKGHPSGVLFPSLSAKGRGDKARVYDVSLAQGMKLDYDADRAYVSFIANEKVKKSIDKMMNDTRYRKGFLEGVISSTELQALARDRAKSAAVGHGESKFIQGLSRLVGQKIETGTVSRQAQRMRLAAAYGASTKEEYESLSYLIAEIEEGAISSKHGLLAEETSSKLANFVAGDTFDFSKDMEDVWDMIWGNNEVQAGQRMWKKEQFVGRMGELLEQSREEEHFAAMLRTVERRSAAAKGREATATSAKQLTTNMAKAVEFFESAQGSPLAPLSREMRMGPGSMITHARDATTAAAQMGGVALKSFKKYWKYPTAAVAGAIAVNWLVGSDEMAMPASDPNLRATELGTQESPSINPPSSYSNRLVSAGGAVAPAGYDMSMGLDLTTTGVRRLTDFGREMGGSVRIRDNRGAITPEYIDKAQRERYI